MIRFRLISSILAAAVGAVLSGSAWADPDPKASAADAPATAKPDSDAKTSPATPEAQQAGKPQDHVLPGGGTGVGVKPLVIPSWGSLGVDVLEVYDALRSQLKLPEHQGVLITSVAKDGAAEKAGIKVHDILMKLDGEPILGSAEFQRRLLVMKPDQKVSVQRISGGKTDDVIVTLSATPPPDDPPKRRRRVILPTREK